MARRPTTPARRKRRTAVCAVLLPLLLAALLLVLDVPFLTARGALAATQERYAFGPGRSLPGSAPSRRACPRYGTTSSATGTGSPGAVWRGTACSGAPAR